MRPEVTGVPQAVPVLRLVPEFCPLPQPSDASWGRNSWASEYVCPRHHSLGSGREAKEKVSCVRSPTPPPGQATEFFILSTNVCIWIYMHMYLYMSLVYI